MSTELDWGLIDFSRYHHVVVMADETVAELYAAKLQQSIPRPSQLLRFPSGECHKNREVKQNLEDQLFAMGCGRDTLLIALGGGVCLDLVGFIAATYCRGVPVVYCPSTLLAMVDVCVGGKTGINTPYGKNLLGVFVEPEAVIINLTYLLSMDAREHTAGYAEVLKHAVIADKEFWFWLNQNTDHLLSYDFSSLRRMILRSHCIKYQIVQQDFREQHRREMLNFGHTVAHALEYLSEYQLLHGEAVAIGMIFEAYVAYVLGYLEKTCVIMLLESIQRFRLPTVSTWMHNFLEFKAAMQMDKKNKSSEIHMVLLQDIGQVYAQERQYSFPIPDQALMMAYDWMMNLC